MSCLSEYIGVMRQLLPILKNPSDLCGTRDMLSAEELLNDAFKIFRDANREAIPLYRNAVQAFKNKFVGNRHFDTVFVSRCNADSNWFCFDFTSQNGFSSTSIDNGDCAYCESCSEYCSNDGYDSDLSRCGTCAEQWREENDESEDSESCDGIRAYQSNPMTVYKGFLLAKGEKKILSPAGENATRYFGIELEVVARGNLQDSVTASNKALRDYAILKYDGSLPSNGYEICTVPASLERHRQEIASRLPGILSKIKSFDCDATGLHVHVSRASISTFTLGKMLVFMGSTHNAKFLETIAQRPETHYARFIPKKFRDARFSDGERYQALHAFTPYRTIEFRLFKGNVAPHAVIKALEFCDALCVWAKDVSADNLNHESFSAFIASNRKAYPALYDFCKSKNLLPSGTKTAHAPAIEFAS